MPSKKTIVKQKKMTQSQKSKQSQNVKININLEKKPVRRKPQPRKPKVSPQPPQPPNYPTPSPSPSPPQYIYQYVPQYASLSTPQFSQQNAPIPPQFTYAPQPPRMTPPNTQMRPQNQQGQQLRPNIPQVTPVQRQSTPVAQQVQPLRQQTGQIPQATPINFVDRYNQIQQNVAYVGQGLGYVGQGLGYVGQGVGQGLRYVAGGLYNNYTATNRNPSQVDVQSITPISITPYISGDAVMTEATEKKLEEVRNFNRSELKPVEKKTNMKLSESKLSVNDELNAMFKIRKELEMKPNIQENKLATGVHDPNKLNDSNEILGAMTSEADRQEMMNATPEQREEIRREREKRGRKFASGRNPIEEHSRFVTNVNSKSNLEMKKKLLNGQLKKYADLLTRIGAKQQDEEEAIEGYVKILSGLNPTDRSYMLIETKLNKANEERNRLIKLQDDYDTLYDETYAMATSDSLAFQPKSPLEPVSIGKSDMTDFFTAKQKQLETNTPEVSQIVPDSLKRMNPVILEDDESDIINEDDIIENEDIPVLEE